MESTEKQKESIRTKNATCMTFDKKIDRSTKFSELNNSFSGADMVAVISIGEGNVRGVHTLGSLQTLSVSTSMQRMPVRSIGNINAKDYVMGQRTIAGSLVFAVFDRHVIFSIMESIKGLSDTNRHFLADELPPFDITINFANEYGKKAKMAIYGIRLINEGQVMSINDIFTENTYQYVATDYDYLTNDDTNASGFMPSVKYNDKQDDVTENSSDEFISAAEKKDTETKRQNIYIKTTDAYTKDGMYTAGKVSIDVSYKDIYGKIMIGSKDYSTELPVNSNTQFPIVVKLDHNIYKAYFISNDKTESDHIGFEIKNIKTAERIPKRPHILNMEKNSSGNFYIKTKESDDCTKKIMSSKDNIVWTELEKSNDEYTVKNAGENTNCYIKSVNIEQESDTINIFTDSRKEHLLSDFFEYASNIKDKNEKINIILSKIHEENQKQDYSSISDIISKVRHEIDFSDNSMAKAYYDVCYICTGYEQKFSEYNSQHSEIRAPRLIDIGRSIVSLEQRVSYIKIDSNFTYSRTISSDSFIKGGDNNLCEIKINTPGMYKLTAFDKNGNKSIPVCIYIPTQENAIAIIEDGKQKTLKEEKEFLYASSKTSIFLNKNIDSKTKNVLLKEITNDYNKTKNGIADPEITYIDDNEVLIHIEAITLVPKQLFLCISKTTDIGTEILPLRILITKQIFDYSLYKNKEGLIDGERYSVWIEDESSIVSGTSGFCVGVSDDITTDLRFEETCERIRSSFFVTSNKEKIVSYKDDFSNSESSIYNQIIIDNINFPLSTESRALIINDSIDSMHKAYNNTSKSKLLFGIEFNLKEAKLIGNYSGTMYTHIIVKSYKDNKKTIKTYTLKNEILFEESQRDSDYISFYLSNDNMDDVSDITTIDMITGETISPFEIEVI